MAVGQSGSWRKLGLVFKGGSNGHPALLTHAALPVPHTLSRDLVRVFYSGRDAANRSAVGSVIIRLGDTVRVETDDPEPALLPGTVGAFDDAGVGVGCIVNDGIDDRLYYMGWNVGGSAPWRNAVGVAFGKAAEGRFERRFEGPLLDRSPFDPFSLSYPWVLRLAPDDWRMWYGSHLKWGADKSDMSHAIRAAGSRDGLTWTREAATCLSPIPPEIAAVRPSVLRRGDGTFEMFFASRGLHTPYAIRRAESQNGHDWRRIEAGIAPAKDGWEAGEITYPAVFQQMGRRWLLYNGSGYGATGFGLAVWEGD